jgi:hypothetical protein
MSSIHPRTLVAYRDTATGYVRYAYEALPIRYLGTPGGKQRARHAYAERVSLLRDDAFNLGHGHYAMWLTDASGQRIEVHIAVPPFVHLYESNAPTFAIDLYIADRNGLFSTEGNRIEGLDRNEWADVPCTKLRDLILADVNHMGVVPCTSCGIGYAWRRAPTWHKQQAATFGRYRAVCESCRLDSITKKFNIEREAELRRLKATDSLHKAKGYTHRVDSWVHPAEGGDDYLLTWYVVQHPTETEVRDILRSHGSAVLTDYTVTEI